LKYLKYFGFSLLFLADIIYSQKTDKLYTTGDSICAKSNNAIFCKTIDFYKNKQYDSTYVYSSKALAFSKTDNEKDFFNCLLGFSSFINGFHKQALLSVNQISERKEYKQIKLYLLGHIYLNLKKYDDAIQNIEEWILNDSYEKISERKVMYHNLALSYIHKKDYFKAKINFDKELYLISADDTLSIIRTKMDLANVYYEQYIDNEAIPLFQEAYNLAKDYSNIEWKQYTAKNMAIVERNRRRYKESVKYYDEFIRWKDSLWNRDKISDLLEKDKQIALGIKDKEIAVQKEITDKQKERTRFFTLAFVAVLLFLGTLFYFYRVKIKQNNLINAQKDQLESLNATKNYLLSVISHDLRTPVKTIKNNHKELSKLLEEKDTASAMVLNQKSTSVAENTSKVLDNILNWALQQNNQLLFMPEFHSIEFLINAILYDFNPIANAKNITLSTFFKDNDIQVYLDRELFKIAFRNLIDNAIKYTPNGGEVTVTTALENNECLVAIKDTGVGMSSELLDTINNYQTLSIEKIERSKGLGLGVLLSKTLIAKNNGSFKITNNKDIGITVSLRLPLEKF